jgi:uridine kinase
MNDILEITCINTNSVHRYPAGTDLYKICCDIMPQLKSQIVAAIVNNELKELSYKLYNPKFIEFITAAHPDGMRTYIRSLTFLLQVAVNEIIPESKLSVQHSLPDGLYCEISGYKSLSVSELNRIESCMRELVEKDLPFTKTKIQTSEAIEKFESAGYSEKALLLETRDKFYTSVYWLNGYADHFYGPLVYSTGHLKIFKIYSFYQGIVLNLPRLDKPDELREHCHNQQFSDCNKSSNIATESKLLQIFQEHKEWNEILGTKSIGKINKIIRNSGVANLIQVSEALHEKSYAGIADKIVEKGSQIILIAGPSSSGKTTSAKRIAVQLQVAKKRPHIIELDNYFVDRELTPLDENGNYDFESLHAIDIELFNSQFKDLLEGKEVFIPRFDFISGKRSFLNKSVKIDENDVIIVEGIHGLNQELISLIPDSKLFRIYVSALTSVTIDENNRISTTDNRLIRRIVRDAATRGYSAADTINRWQSVRRGEDRNIFPFQENADIMFNSSLPYELSILRKYAEPLLRKIPPLKPEYAEALRLLKFIGYFDQIDSADEKNIPSTSVLREFIGKSSFNY